MCVAAVAWHAHPDWKLVVIGNRDEFHDRPASALSRRQENGEILAGRDDKSGGTWLGVSEAGRFALVTNRRGFGDPDPLSVSRGRLVTEILAGEGKYSEPETASVEDFNPFNLIADDAKSARFLSNRTGAIRSSLLHGIYGLSNGALDEPWPKTLHLKTALLEWMNNQSGNLDLLFGDLANEVSPDVGLHPSQPSEISDEARDTAPFIRHPVYGTRCSTVLAIDHDGQGRILERRFIADGSLSGESSMGFRWPI